MQAAPASGADGFIRKDLPREEILVELVQILSNQPVRQGRTFFPRSGGALGLLTDKIPRDSQ